MNIHILRLALAQINTTVGDIPGNAALIRRYVECAKEAMADIVVFPELTVTGYPPEDLLLKPDFLAANLRALEEVAEFARGIVVVVGFVASEQVIYNAAGVLSEGRVIGIHRKHHLPNYGVFDEQRYFTPGDETAVYKLGECCFGVSVCEDMWYADGPHRRQASSGADLLININASPFHAGKWMSREEMLAARSLDNVAAVAYLNLVGGQDELVFDGHSLVLDQEGQVLARGPAFEEALIVCDVGMSPVRARRLTDPRWKSETSQGERVHIIHIPQSSPPASRPSIRSEILPPPDRLSEIYAALVLGTRDYVRKNGFSKVVIGLSGGVDSSLTATIAADALGPQHVTGVSMPSRISSVGSRKDAAELARRLGIRFITIPIRQIHDAYLRTLRPQFAETAPDVTEENLQARTRGNILMALSNKFGWLALTTGNKSETATGYCTLYGDMAGGFAVLKDVPKTLVYELAAHRNTYGEVIPEIVLTKPPSAELRPDQKDSDSLPPYEVLDPILHLYIEEDLSLTDIVARGFDETIVRRVIRLVDGNEYKRRQSPPGIKITPKAFGKDRRLPITNGYRS